MRKLVAVVLLLNAALGRAQDDVVYYQDALRGEAMIDAFVVAFDSDSVAKRYLLEQKIITRLFATYDETAYVQTLRHLHALENKHPDAVLALSDSIQAYWDSHYLQSYLVGSADAYGKLKFLATLGMIGGGLGLLKNPLASLATLKNLNFLLPLSGGVGAYYAVEFFRKPPDVPRDPQQILSFASGKRYFAYEQKRNDYLYRLFAVGIGLGAGEFIFKTLGKDFVASSRSAASNRKQASSKKSTASAPGHGGLAYVEEQAVPNDGRKFSESVQNAGRGRDSLFRPRLTISYLSRAAATVFGIYLLHKGTHYLLRTLEIKRVEGKFHRARADFNTAVQIGDQQTLITTAKALFDTTLQLVTLYELPHLHTIVEFEKEFSKEAMQLQVGTDEDMRVKLQEMTMKLSKSLRAKLQRAIAVRNYRYESVPLLQAMTQMRYSKLRTDNNDERIAQLLQEFAKRDINSIPTEDESTGDRDAEFNRWVQAELADRYAVAQQTLAAGKLQHNIELLFQVAALFKASSTAHEFAFLQHFYQHLLAKFQNMLLMYRNFAKIIEHNAVWEIEFSAAELEAVLDLYLDYYQADNRSAVQLPQQQGQKLLTSTRGFARFLAEYIAALPTKPYNQLILRILDIYHTQPQQRAALLTLVQDIEEKVEIHDRFYDTAWLATIEGGFIAAGLLMAGRMAAKLVHVLGADVSKPRWQWIARLLGTGKHWAQLGKTVVVGSAAGYVYHFVKKLRTHKLPPETALLGVQKVIALDLAHKSCLLRHEVDAERKDHEQLETFNAEQIQQEREKIAAFATRLRMLSGQTNHLHEAAPRLRVNHTLPLPQTYYGSGVCAPKADADGDTVVSITPLTQDLEQVGGNLSRWKQTLDIIEYRRRLQAQ